MRRWRPVRAGKFAAGAALLWVSPTAWGVGSFDIQVNAGATLAQNAAAMDAFNRAAAQWESFIADPITVVIDADLGPLGATTLG